MAEQDDTSLMEKLAAGDRQALRVLYERHAELVYRVAFRFLGDIEDARDVTQTVFVAILQSAARYRPEAKLTTWIYRIAVNRCLNQRAKAHVQRRELAREREIERLPASDTQQPDRIADRAAQQARLQAALRKLPERQRMALILALMTALPVTLVINFALMRLAGLSINVSTLAGLVIALGVLLGNAIVVVESVSRRREERDEKADESAVAGTVQVAGAVLAGTLTLLGLFVPYVLVSGLTSLLFRELILVVAGVVVVSLVCSLTTGSFCSRWPTSCGAGHGAWTRLARCSRRRSFVCGRG